jgi:hypothetical protein
MKITNLDDLNKFLLEAIEICSYEIKKLYECGQGKQHPDYSNLTCSKWIYERMLERIEPEDACIIEEVNNENILN